MELTFNEIKSISQYADEGIAHGIINNQKMFKTYGINDTVLPYFLSQLAFESDGFRTTEEYASGNQYEGRRDLGNTEPGDGRRFKGRGLIQLTGRSNYRTYGELLKEDFERFPELVAEFPYALSVSCLFWKTHGLNKYAEKDDFEKITRLINGGLNGFQQRLVYLAKTRDALGI